MATWLILGVLVLLYSEKIWKAVGELVVDVFRTAGWFLKKPARLILLFFGLFWIWFLPQVFAADINCTCVNNEVPSDANYGYSQAVCKMLRATDPDDFPFECKTYVFSRGPLPIDGPGSIAVPASLIKEGGQNPQGSSDPQDQVKGINPGQT